MKKSLFFIVFIFISFFSYSIIYDDLTIDKNSVVSLKVHNLNNAEVKSLKIFINGKEYTAPVVEKLKNKWLFSVIIDNSGSMELEDFFTILDRVDFLLKNIDKEDFLVVWKLNNQKKEIYPLSTPNEKLSPQILSLIREGKLTRLYDGIIQAKKEIFALSKEDRFKEFHPYLIVFSDGDDIGSKAKKEQIYTTDNKIPFFFFSYINLPDKKIIEPFKELCKLTNGKILERPTNDEIKKLFIDKENRYLIKFKIDKKDINKKKEYFVEINSKDKNLKIDISKIFSKEAKEDKIKIVENKNTEDNIILNDNTKNDKKNNKNTNLQDNSQNIKNDNKNEDKTTKTDKQNIENNQTTENTINIKEETSDTKKYTQLTDLTEDNTVKETTGDNTVVIKENNLQVDTTKDNNLNTTKKNDKTKIIIDFSKFSFIWIIIIIILSILLLILLFLIIRKIVLSIRDKKDSSGGGGTRRLFTSGGSQASYTSTSESQVKQSNDFKNKNLKTVEKTPIHQENIKKEEKNINLDKIEKDTPKEDKIIQKEENITDKKQIIEEKEDLVNKNQDTEEKNNADKNQIMEEDIVDKNQIIEKKEDIEKENVIEEDLLTDEEYSALIEKEIIEKENILSKIDEENQLEEVIDKKEPDIKEEIVEVKELFTLGEQVLFREKEDLLSTKKYNKFSVFYNEKTNFVDEAEHFGEEIFYDFRFKVESVTNNTVTCATKINLLLDEVVNIKDVKLKTVKIIYNTDTKEYLVSFVPYEQINLTDIFIAKQEIIAEKKAIVFGNPDAIIEKMISHNKNSQSIRSLAWEKATILEIKDNRFNLLTSNPLILDTIIEIRKDHKTLQYKVSKCQKTNDGFVSVVG